MERKSREIEGKFALGQIVGTPGALGALQRNQADPIQYIIRHWTGDWGDLDDEDKVANDSSVSQETRLISAYNLEDGTRFWIITEADRSATTLLLPEEY